MSKAQFLKRLGLAITVLAMAGGCTTTGNFQRAETHQFDPQPVAQVDKRDLAPVEPRSATELLEAAGEAFKEANKAQEAGDIEDALRHYTMMLELLIEADLDPSVFYNLRDEFSRILEEGTENAVLAKHERPEWEPGEFPQTVAGTLPIPFPLPERVQREIQKIQEVYPRNFQGGLDRSSAYVDYVKKRFQEEGLPEDLVWLAMVESQFHPRVVSRAGAGGMWQFMSATGRRYGLRVDSYVDERFNWEKSTEAAIDYLSDLHEMFSGNWPLAVSAYNMGEHGLERTIAAAGGERDLWRLLETGAADRHIRLETKEFYPKLCATVLVARSPERYGFSVTPQERPETVRVAVKNSYSLEDLEDACGLSRGTLKNLNPELVKGLTPPNETFQVEVPASIHQTFLAKLDSVPTYRPGFHIVLRGETPSHIAQRHGVRVSDLMRVNKIRSARHLQVGQRLVIPGTMVKGGSSSSSKSVQASTGGIYAVRQGDCLYDIAKAHGVGIDDLRKWNDLGRSSRIQVGQKLRIGTASATASSSPTGEKKVHVVTSGECPSTIAERYGIKTSELLAWNNLSHRSTIRTGQKLVVYASNTSANNASAKAEAAAPSVRKHTVARGENPWTIAMKYGVPVDELLKANGLNKNSVLQIGDEIEIPAAPRTKEARRRAVHVVERGQNPSTIAKHYGVPLGELFKWNSWKRAPVLQVGSEVVVFP